MRRKKNTSRGTKLASSHRRDLSKPTEATPPPAALTLPKVPAVVPEELDRLARERRLTEQQHAPQIRIWLQMAGINEREIDARTRLILDSLDRPGAEAAPAKLYDVGRQFVARDIGLSVPQTKQLGRLVITELTNDSARKSDGMSPVETFLSQLLRPLNVAQGKC